MAAIACLKANNVIAILLFTFLAFYSTLVPLLYADAWLAGIRKRQAGSFKHFSPLGWSLLVSFVAVVGLPLYIWNRPKLKTRKGSTVIWVLILVISVLDTVMLAAIIVVAPVVVPAASFILLAKPRSSSPVLSTQASIETDANSVLHESDTNSSWTTSRVKDSQCAFRTKNRLPDGNYLYTAVPASKLAGQNTSEALSTALAAFKTQKSASALGTTSDIVVSACPFLTDTGVSFVEYDRTKPYDADSAKKVFEPLVEQNYCLFACRPDGKNSLVTAIHSSKLKGDTVEAVREEALATITKRPGADTLVSKDIAIMTCSVPEADSNSVAQKGSRGLEFLNGDGIDRDFSRAIDLCTVAAFFGDATGQYCLGQLYDDGSGVRKDQIEALRWLRLAVAQDNAMAQNRLGMMYVRGQGVLKNEVEGVRLVRLAADKGFAKAQNNMGVFYEHGIGGLPMDLGEAVRWWELSAAQGHEPARKMLRYHGLR